MFDQSTADATVEARQVLWLKPHRDVGVSNCAAALARTPASSMRAALAGGAKAEGVQTQVNRAVRIIHYNRVGNILFGSWPQRLSAAPELAGANQSS